MYSIVRSADIPTYWPGGSVVVCVAVLWAFGSTFVVVVAWAVVVCGAAPEQPGETDNTAASAVAMTAPTQTRGLIGRVTIRPPIFARCVPRSDLVEAGFWEQKS